MITNKNFRKKIWVDKGTEFVGKFKKLCNAQGKQIYSVMNDNKAAFVETTIRAYKNILYRYMEDCGYKYIHKVPRCILNVVF